MKKVEIAVERLILPTYAEPAAEELPMFAENRVHQRTSGNPYPNKIVARVDREHRVDKEYTAVRLENEYVRVVVLPEIGGRIYSATDKTTGYDFFYKQHVIKPALIGVLGSWISGGVEFNWPFHHRASGYMPCDFSVEECADGSAVCHLSEHDPIDRMKGMVSIVLRPEESFFETRMRLYNRTDVPHSFLWWENAAVPVNEDYQIFFPQDVTYVNFHYLKSRISYPIAGNGVFNGIPMKEPRDISFHKNTREATSYFASASDYDFFGGYDHGKRCGVVHVGDHHVSPGKKMFTWAYGQLSKSWENALTDTDGQYAELMAGSYSDNQPDFSWLAPYETKQFSQYWYPIHAIGAPTFANLNCAFRVSRSEAGAVLTLQSCRRFAGATVRVLDGARVCFEDVLDLSPDAPAERVLGDLPAYVTVEVLNAEGKRIAHYTEKSYDVYKMPPVITDMPLAEEMESAQELYLAGVHVDQYRDPAVKPDAYWLQALAREPLHIPSLVSMARYEYVNHRLEAAERYAQRAVDALSRFNRHPMSGEAFYVLGQILEAEGKRDAAYDAYVTSSFSADCVSAAMTRASVLDLRRGDAEAAVQHAVQALDYGRNNSLARAVRVLALRECGEAAAAGELVRAYLSEDPLDHLLRFVADAPDFYAVLDSNPTQTCLDLCADLEDMGRYADARRLLKGLLDNAPAAACKIAFYALGYYTELCGNTGDEFYALARTAPIGPTYPIRPCEERMLLSACGRGDCEAKMLLGCLCYHRRNYLEAARLWEECSDSRIAKRNLAVAYFSHLGRSGEALAIMYGLCERYPEDEAILYETAVLMNKMNVPATQKIALLEARSFTRDDVTVELVKSYNQAGMHDRAIETLLSHAFVPCEGGEHSIADQYIFAHLAKGREAMKAGRYAEALELLEAGRHLPQILGAGIWNHCKHIPLRYWQAVCLEELGRRGEAEEIYRYITGTEIEYFSNMHLPELPYYQALSHDRLGEHLAARGIVTRYRRAWNGIEGKKDNGFFGTTPFFMPFVDDPARMRRSHALYLCGLMDSYLGEPSAAEKLRESYELNNDRLTALLYF